MSSYFPLSLNVISKGRGDDPSTFTQVKFSMLGPTGMRKVVRADRSKNQTKET